MSILNRPLRFEPFLRPMVWGGRRLARDLGKMPAADGLYGESWEVSDHPTHASRLVEGPADVLGKTLPELRASLAAELIGRRAPAFPWLIKFLDAADRLSVQVHPDDAKARVLCPGEGGKSEAWFILHAEPTARVWAGLRPGVGPERFRVALKSGEVVSCLHSLTPRAGQCLFLPAGVVHAVGGGVLLAEVQQTSDATFRLFDWNRKDAQRKPRTLHIEQGLAAIDWQRGPVAPVAANGFPGLRVNAWPASLSPRRQELARCEFFTLSYVQGCETVHLDGDGTLQAAIILAGRGRFDTGEAVHGGQTWVLPAALGETSLTPEPPGIVLLECRL